MPRRALPMLVLLGWLIVPGNLHAEPREWDLARVTELADRLVTELAEGRKAAAKAPAQESVHQQRTRDAAVVRVEQVHRVALEYRRLLRPGVSRFETEGLFISLRDLASGVGEEAGDAVPRREPIGHWRNALHLISELGEYYEL